MMKAQWTFHGCGDQIKSEIQEYWAKKLPRVERVLGRFPDDLRELSISIHKQWSPERFEGRLVLRLPTGTLITEETDVGVRPLLDRLTDDLVANIKRHTSRLHHGWANRRRSNWQEEPAAPLTPLEYNDAAYGGSDIARAAG